MNILFSGTSSIYQYFRGIPASFTIFRDKYLSSARVGMPETNTEIGNGKAERLGQLTVKITVKIPIYTLSENIYMQQPFLLFC